MKTKNLFIVLLILVVIFACKKDKDTNTGGGGTGRVLGDVGNTWNAKFNGNQDIQGKIIGNDNGIITLTLTIEGKTETIKMKLTEDGVYDFIYSLGDTTKPFELVKWDAEIGTVWTFNVGNVYFARHVIEKETYYIEALHRSVPTIGVYEYIPDEIDYEMLGYVIREMTCYWHETYGLVCIDIWTEDGQWFEIKFVSIIL